MFRLIVPAIFLISACDDPSTSFRATRVSAGQTRHNQSLEEFDIQDFLYDDSDMPHDLEIGDIIPSSLIPDRVAYGWGSELTLYQGVVTPLVHVIDLAVPDWAAWDDSYQKWCDEYTLSQREAWGIAPHADMYGGYRYDVIVPEPDTESDSETDAESD